MSGSKVLRMTNETFGGEPNLLRFQELLDFGWQIVHEKKTAYLSLHHPNGGKVSLLEVKTHGTNLTVGEADEVARVVGEFLIEKFNKKEKDASI